ncbi:hypothetical protein D1872_217120 [compost metagenome]
MKAIPKIGLDGLYIEDTLVDDAFSGVVPFYADPPAPDPDIPPETDPEAEEAPEETPEPEIAGYIVGVPVPSGLFRPCFDLGAWEAYQDAVEAAQKAYQAEYAEWSAQPEDKPIDPPAYIAPEQPELWGEGLTPEEIEELTRSNPQEPSATDLLGAELTSMKLQNIQQQQTISALGAELAAVKLDVIKLRGVEQA